MAEFRRRKCSALALASLLALPEFMEAIPDQMAHIITMAIGIMADEEGIDMPVRPLGPKRGFFLSFFLSLSLFLSLFLSFSLSLSLSILKS
jgi:hypothetical protein